MDTQNEQLFGGDQELLLQCTVLAETLDADKPAFIQRWYKKDDYDSNVSDDIYNRHDRACNISIHSSNYYVIVIPRGY